MIERLFALLVVVLMAGCQSESPDPESVDTEPRLGSRPPEPAVEPAQPEPREVEGPARSAAQNAEAGSEPATEPPCMGEPIADRMCTAVYLPVCGCDGKTYSNACVAETAGILRWEDGECDPQALQ